METASPTPRDVAVPGGTFAALRRKLTEEVGPLTAIHVLQSAGYEAGSTLFDSLAAEVDGEPAAMDRPSFFARLERFLAARGWGVLHHSMPHPGIGLLSSSDWAEAGEEGGETEPSCAFSSGMLSALLTRAVGTPVAIVQVGCRSRGDESCSFAFGSEAAVHELYRLLLEDRDLETALAEL